MLILVEQISSRLIYTFDFVFKNRNLYYQFTNDKNEFINYLGIKFSYLKKPIDDNYNFVPSPVLFDEKIINYKIEKADFQGQECLKFDEISDLFASIFFVLTRYEEYILNKKDEHGRFVTKQSFQYKYNWINKCICDRWAEHILDLLNKNICEFYVKKNNIIKIIPTFDIDNTFAFKWKNSFRNKIAKLRDLYRKDKNRLVARKLFENNKANDPYDTFDLIKSIQKNYETKIFWHVGSFSHYDKNISIFNQDHQNLIREMSKYGEIGIHPSYKSFENYNILTNEIDNLSSVLNKKIEISRQHFLRLYIPHTYIKLINLGVKNDYTMGFADELGFRIGTAKSIYFFDLTENKVKNLIITPFVYMDGTLLEYKKLNIQQAKDEIENLFNEVKKFGGNFSFIWHNETIGDFDKWKGWSEVLKFTLNLNNCEI